jgi:hypothetical protein
VKHGVTWIVVGALALLAALALADALRPSESSRPEAAPATTRARPPTLRETLRVEAVSGFVLYSDRGCRLHSLLLPRIADDLVRDEDGAAVIHCRFGVAAGRIVGDLDALSPTEMESATCNGGRITVRDTTTGGAVRSFRGCEPAWRPDGRLTYARGEAVLEEQRVLFGPSELRRAGRLHPNVAGLRAKWPLRTRVVELAWLDEERIVVSLAIKPRNVETQYLAVLFDGKAVTGLAVSFRGPYGGWFVSPSGRYAAAEDGTIMARDGGSIDPPQGVPQGRAVVFSPDERWLAWLSGVNVYLIATPHNVAPERIIRLPIPAQDLIWEPISSGTSGVPPGT